MPVITPRKTILEIRFVPKISFSHEIGKAAESILEEVGGNKWQWDPLSIEVFDLLRNLRFAISHDRTVCEMDGPEEHQDIEQNYEIVKKSLQIYGGENILRIGIRQWFAIEIDKLTEQKLIDKLKAVYLKVASFEESLEMQMEDMALILEMSKSSDSQFSARVVVGAMNKKQWTSHTPYPGTRSEPKLPHVPGGINVVLGRLPEDFVLIDIDKRNTRAESSPVISASKCDDFISNAANDQKKIPKMLIEDIRSGLV